MKDKYITVTALTKYLKKKMDIDPHLQTVWIRGEISNFKHHSRRHMYFTIKDEQTRIPAVMFFRDNQHLKFTPENGMKVLIKGNVTVFEAYGQYQLYIRELEPDGIGALFLAYEQLKEKLEHRGYFDHKHKKKIATYPTHIGVITSPSGAAVRDIITTIKRRYPITQITVIPAIVQGDAAANSLIEAIERANQLNMFDTLIVGRGGGSIEDLWVFNYEAVAKSIFYSNIPIISGIGHETDLTISDFTADLRAPTPTGAAELAVPSILDLQTTIHQFRSRLVKLIQYHILEKKQRFQAMKKSAAFHKPTHLLQEKVQYVDRLMDEMQYHYSRLNQIKTSQLRELNLRLQYVNPKNKFEEGSRKLSESKHSLHKQMELQLKQKQHHLKVNVHKLTLLNPLEIIKRGFAIPYASDGTIIKSTKRLKKDDMLSMKLVDGNVLCTVQHIWEDQKND